MLLQSKLAAGCIASKGQLAVTSLYADVLKAMGPQHRTALANAASANASHHDLASHAQAQQFTVDPATLKAASNTQK